MGIFRDIFQPVYWFGGCWIRADVFLGPKNLHGMSMPSTVALDAHSVSYLTAAVTHSRTQVHREQRLINWRHDDVSVNGSIDRSFTDLGTWGRRVGTACSPQKFYPRWASLAKCWTQKNICSIGKWIPIAVVPDIYYYYYYYYYYYLLHLSLSLGGSSRYTSTDKTNNIHKLNNTKTQHKEYETQ